MGMQPVPAGTAITQHFGTNPGGFNPVGGHTGRDWATVQLIPLAAPDDGVVLWADWCHKLPGGPNGWAQRWFFDLSFGGIIVVIRHNGYLSTYSHLYSTHLNIGDHVRKGDLIARTGNTGSATSGPHLHFESMPPAPLWNNGTFGRINPAPFVQEPYRLTAAPPPRVTPPPKYLNGIDVSEYQPADIVRRVPADFVIVKVTESGGRTAWTSKHWREQLADARRLGRSVGVYHYAQPGRNSSDVEADFFVSTVGQQHGRDLVYFLDWEEEGFYNYTVWARDFMARVDQLTGSTCGLYANTAGLIGGVWTAKDRARPLWRAYPLLKGTGYASAFNMPAPPPGWSRPVMDQYSFHGRLPGYAADLDLNVYYGGLPQWADTGTPITLQRDWFDMATEADLRRIVREENDRHWNYQRKKIGPGVGGTVSYGQQVLWLAADFKEIRDRLDAVGRAVTPAALKAALVDALPAVELDAPDLDQDKLAADVARHLAAVIFDTLAEQQQREVEAAAPSIADVLAQNTDTKEN